MLAFNIIKPDMLDNKDSLNFYFDYMNSNFDIDEVRLYEITNWTELAKQIYELEVEKSITTIEKLQKRKQILTTILGYHIYFPKNTAMLSIYNVEDDNLKTLEELTKFKKSLRKNYVYNTDKYYLRIKNEKIVDYSKPLQSVNLNSISTDNLVIPNNQDLNDDSFSMIYFNKLHFPDPNITVINSELDVLKRNDIINIKKLVRRMQL